jgi:glucokinase
MATRSASRLHRLGIDLGGSKIWAVVLDAEGKILGRSKRSTKAEKGYRGVLERIAKTAEEALEEAELTIADVSTVGMGVPGPVNKDRDVIEMAVNLGWDRKPLAKDLTALLKRPVVLENDVKAGAVGELTHGEAKGASSALMAFVGTGLGGALTVGNQVLIGAHGYAGEIGHMPAPFSTATCSCGRKGCLETMASKRGIIRLIAEAKAAGKKCCLKQAEEGHLRASELKAALDDGCAATRWAMDQASEALAWGLAAVGSAFDPEVIVLGGGVIEALGKKEMLPILLKRMPQWSVLYQKHPPKIRISGLGDDAVAVGAAVLAAEWLASSAKK